MRKLLSIFLVITMLVTTCTVATAYYTDIDGHWAETEINAWSKHGVISGYNGEFAPNRNMTRGEFAVVLKILMGYQKQSKNVFADLSDKFYTSAILSLNEAGVMQGYDGLINPEAQITREEASVMICRALGIKTADEMKREFSDTAEISSWSKAYMNALVNSGLLNGFDGKLNPKAPITRSEVIKILDNAVYPITKSGTYENINTNKIVVINVGDVVIKDSEFKGKVVVTQGAVEGNISFTNSKIESELVVDNDREAFVEMENTTVSDEGALENDAIVTEKPEETKPSGGGGGGGSWGNSGTQDGTGTTTPDSGETTPGTGETTPDSGETTPGTGETTPGTGETTPGAGETTPGTGETTPGTGETTPGAGEVEPGETDHNMTFNEEVPATCEEAGTKAHYVCTICGKTFEDEEGNTELTSLTIPATGHTYGEYTKVDDTNHKQACSCGDEVTEAHTWNAGIVTVMPTTETEGERTYTCTACGHLKTEVVAKLKVIKVTFFDGYGEDAVEYDEVELTLDIDGKGSVEEADIPSKTSWTGYEKKDYMPSSYADYYGKHEVESEYFYRENGEWKVFNESTILTEDTEAYLLFERFFIDAFGTAIETRYNKNSRLLDTVKAFLNSAIEQLNVAKDTGLSIYDELSDSILGMIKNSDLIDNDEYVKKIDIILEFSSFEELQNSTFDEVLETERGETLASMVALVGYEVCERVFNTAKENAENTSDGPIELVLTFDPIEDIFKPIYKDAEEKAISEFDASIRYNENPYLQYLIEELDMFSELFQKEETAENAGYKMRDIIDYFKYMVKLLIATDDAICYYNGIDGVDTEVIHNAVLAKVSAVNDKISEACTDSQYENLPNAVTKILESVQKINDIFLGIEPVFDGEINIQAELEELVDSGELDSMVDEIKNSQTSSSVDIDALAEVIRNIAEHGTAYYKVDTSADETILSKYVLDIGGDIFTLQKYLEL